MGRSEPHHYMGRTPFTDIHNAGMNADRDMVDRGRPDHVTRDGYNHDSRNDRVIHGYSPTRRDTNNQSFNEFDRFAGHLDKASTSHQPVRSRTPGPEFMRGRDDEQFSRPVPDIRSKTPTEHGPPGSRSDHGPPNSRTDHGPPGNRTDHGPLTVPTISGTPNFIPASLYQAPPHGQNIRHPAHHNAQHSSSSRSSDPINSRNVDSSAPSYNNKDAYSLSSSQGHLTSNSSYANSPNLSTQNRTYKQPFDNTGRTLSPAVEQTNPRKQSTSFENEEPAPSNLTRLQKWGGSPSGSLDRSRSPTRPEDRGAEFSIILRRQESGFGFRIIGGTEEGSQVSLFVEILRCNSVT